MLRAIFMLLFIPIASLAQFTYKLDQSAPVEVDGRNLSMPWSGGLNSAQLNKIDFDGDGNEDLVVYDRAAAKILPFRNAGNKYEYSPFYAELFPETVNAWMLLRDFNCDGKPDLFTSDPFGIVVFVNTTKPGQALSWRPFNPGFPLLTQGFNGNINLKINDVDIPSIDDVDNDGDLDILAMRFVGIGTIEWHKNMSVENTGKCDSMQLQRITQTYGGMTECTCGNFSFGNQPCDNGGRVEHVGGKALLDIDIDNDGDRDLLYAEETCPILYLLRNNGTLETPVYTSAIPFPQPSAANFQFFPAPFFEDVDFDGLRDLIVSPNLYSRTFDNILVRNSIWFYKNTGTAQQPNFTLTKNNLLQEDMIDVGDFSVPAMIDMDNDGDLDLFIGLYGNESFRGTLYQFENTGTASEPKFKFITSDYGNISYLALYNVKPMFADANGDGKRDLAFSATSLQDGLTSLYFVPNTVEEGFVPNFAQAIQTSVQIQQSETIAITDVNKDGVPDLLIGKATGALEYWENSVSDGTFDHVTLANKAFLGLNNSTSRQSPAVAVGDLDADGLEDLVLGDQRGALSFYGDYRHFDSKKVQAEAAVVYDELTQEYDLFNFGGKAYPTIANMFNSSRPAVLVGSTLGGVTVLKNDNGIDLPADPVVGIGRNPLPRGEDLRIRADRNTKVQIFTVLGQKMSEPIFIPANQEYPLTLNELAAGMYIARFTFPGRSISVKFILL
ncbi:MAG: T9SS type A sorting domain-containing protein [Bacteroidota bacterium]